MSPKLKRRLANRKLVLLRTEANWTQPELAIRAGVHFNCIKYLELGISRRPHRDTARRIAYVLSRKLKREILPESIFGG